MSVSSTLVMWAMAGRTIILRGGTQPHQRLSRALNKEFRGVVMSMEAVRSAQVQMVRDDIEARLDTREMLEAVGEYSKGQHEGMGSLELLDGYPE